jgi:hypothetical protein
MSNDRFVDLCLAGGAILSDIDEFVSRWHQATTAEPLSTFLGMTQREYEMWVEDPDVLPHVLASRRFGTNLEQMLDKRTAIAARAANPSEAEELISWLRRRGEI